MSTGMYKPDKQSKVYIYVLFFTAVLISWGFYIYSRPLAIEEACSEISEKTSGLTRSFDFDPMGDYGYSKAKCIQDALSSKE